MSDLHTYKVMQEGDADVKYPRSQSPRQPGITLVEVIVVILVLLVIAAILFPYFTTVRNGHPRNRVLSNLKQLALAIHMYAADSDEHLPPAERWMDAIEPYHKSTQLPHDPSIKDRKDDEYGFAFFEPVSCIDSGTVCDPDKVPLLFQSVLMGRSAHSDLSTLPTIPRNGKMNYVAFLDGHAKAFPPTWPNGPITIVIDPSPDEGGAKE